MGFSLNKQSLLGKLGQDAEVKTVRADLTVTTFSVATEESYKKNDDWVRTTTWHNIVAFNLSEWSISKLNKGAQVYLEGVTTHEQYEDKEGNKKRNTKVKMDNRSLIITQEAGDNQRTEVVTSNNDNEDLPF